LEKCTYGGRNKCVTLVLRGKTRRCVNNSSHAGLCLMKRSFVSVFLWWRVNSNYFIINLNNILQSAFQFPQSIVSLSMFVENTCCLACPAIYGFAFTLLCCLVGSVGISAASVQRQLTESVFVEIQIGREWTGGLFRRCQWQKLCSVSNRLIKYK